MCEDRTQNYDPEIREEYLIHDTPGPPATSFMVMCRLYTSFIHQKLVARF